MTEYTMGGNQNTAKSSEQLIAEAYAAIRASDSHALLPTPTGAPVAVTKAAPASQKNTRSTTPSKTVSRQQSRSQPASVAPASAGKASAGSASAGSAPKGYSQTFSPPVGSSSGQHTPITTQAPMTSEAPYTFSSTISTSDRQAQQKQMSTVSVPAPPSGTPINISGKPRADNPQVRTNRPKQKSGKKNNDGATIIAWLVGIFVVIWLLQGLGILN